MKLIYSTQDIPLIVAQHIIPRFTHFNIFTLTGPLGAGKTTLTKEILKQCDISETVTSPTFSYVNPYQNKQGQSFYHFDLYRIGSIDEFLIAGFDEFLNKENAWCIVEWPHVINDLLSKAPLLHRTCSLSLDYNDKPRERRLLNLEP